MDSLDRAETVLLGNNEFHWIIWFGEFDAEYCGS